MNGAPGARAAVGARGGSRSLGREWVGGSEVGGGGEGRERARGGGEGQRGSGEAAGVSESGGRRVGRFGAAVRCAASALAARHRLRDPEELPAPRTGQRSRD